MKISEDLLEAKKLMSKSWLKKRLKGKVALRMWTVSLSAAVEGVPPNIHAVGIGRKLVQGKPSKELAIRFYVVQKMAKSLLSVRACLPESVHGFPTDVIESPPAIISWPQKRAVRFRAASTICSTDRRKRQRPVIGGISSGHVNITAGTLACFCQSTRYSDDRSQVYVITEV